ncbi:hypothetical protein FA95DRAFT_47664 [Auriscalpium vulgare]|uniref:Uncharacterized protein n=1 Tax=Auriscalpium vulgare TaxID=40419 RepID=A0ACB8SD83_9AGAM|nr:hypothetical protein FA95DRAFT_47664 [Auriscalpium vulgare]
MRARAPHTLNWSRRTVFSVLYCSLLYFPIASDFVTFEKHSSVCQLVFTTESICQMYTDGGRVAYSCRTCIAATCCRKPSRISSYLLAATHSFGIVLFTLEFWKEREGSGSNARRWL